MKTQNKPTETNRKVSSRTRIKEIKEELEDLEYRSEVISLKLYNDDGIKILDPTDKDIKLSVNLENYKIDLIEKNHVILSTDLPRIQMGNICCGGFMVEIQVPIKDINFIITTSHHHYYY